MKLKLPEVTGTLDERLRIQHQRNVIVFEHNAAQLRKNEKFLKWFGWFDRIMGGEVRYQTGRLIKADADLHAVDREVLDAMKQRGLWALEGEGR